MPEDMKQRAREVLCALLDAVSQPVALALLLVLVAIAAFAEEDGRSAGTRAGAIAEAVDGAMSRADRPDFSAPSATLGSTCRLM